MLMLWVIWFFSILSITKTAALLGYLGNKYVLNASVVNHVSSHIRPLIKKNTPMGMMIQRHI